MVEIEEQMKSINKGNKRETVFEVSNHYKNLGDEAKFVFQQIKKYHGYFAQKDRHYNWIVKILKITILLLAMINTIVLGLNGFFDVSYQVIVGLVSSALITFLSAVAAYFNFEEYWMRNISIHIELNIIRDDFIFDTNSGKMDSSKTLEYQEKLTKIQQENIRYWKKIINKI